KYHNSHEIREWANAEYEMEKKYFLEMKENDFDILKIYPFLSEEMLKEVKQNCQRD
ncbi:unnamed protein product, partial [marine sediment metagenome]